MRSLIVLLLVAPLFAADPDPEVLYKGRANLASARQALDLWEARLKANPRDFESAWKAARAMYWIGPREEKDRIGRKVTFGRRRTWVRLPSRTACGRD
jgi:hypothetical protein